MTIRCDHHFLVILPLLFSWFCISNAANHDDDEKLIIFTVATEKTDGYLRFMKAADKYGHQVKVLGMGEEWKGGDVRLYAGGGQKVKLLKRALEDYKSAKDVVILFTDSYDAILTATPDEILRRFHEDFDGAKIVFSAEVYCWPDKSLAVKYPVVKFGKRYLNSGGFMGYIADVYEMLSSENSDIEDDEDDQLFYTRIFLDNGLRDKYSIQLDSLSKIFQTLNGVSEDIVLDFTPKSKKDPQIRNIAYGTSAAVVHGNGASKILINWLGNYIGKNWNSNDGCAGCNEDKISPIRTEDTDFPLVTTAVFVHRPTFFLDFFFQRLSNLTYPKSRIDLILHNKEEKHEEEVHHFLSKYSADYRSVRVLSANEVDDRLAKERAVDHCLEKSCQYLFIVDSEAQLTKADAIESLIEVNRPLVAPMLTRPGKLWTNFWGSLSDEGFYARSEDYVELVQYRRKGIWNVPYVSTIFLIRADRLKHLRDAFSYNKRADSDMSFAEFNRDHGYFMTLDNSNYYGHLINSEDYDGKLVHPDMYQIFDNRLDWELKYIHENYSKVLADDYVLEQPCPDVYWFPLFSEKFCRQLIDMMEAFGKWSDGSNTDNRLSGGYENVPTRDIHMNQVGFERHWLYILDEFVRPVQEKVFVGYYHRPVKAIMNFVVRYRPDEQPSLRPHHDASTYTINLSLNRPHIDYEGGGARFIRYNCSVVETRQGWGLLHPGRLTHYHEGLQTTSGTRYIVISFIDP